MMIIAFIGNFTVPFSTESHHKWTWEKMGHTVRPLQENRTNPEAVVQACQGAQVCQWTHTHGWEFATPEQGAAMLANLHGSGVKTFSYHLDVYHGLNTLDRREDGVGRHPAWKVQHWFSTDGGHEDFFRSRGVNHHWLPPGVVEYGCSYGTAQERLRRDIAFVGSTHYHPEYPFRPRMVDALKSHFGQRFTVYQGFREQALNDLYASVKVIVGDHCFAGTPRYWSDRVPETCGRGGFLIYPRTEGLDIPLATYEPQNTADLIAQVERYLVQEKEREDIRRTCHEYVKTHYTYTHLLQKVLATLGC